MQINLKGTYIEFGDWELVNSIYWFRKDLSEPRSKWAKESCFNSNNVAGFLIKSFIPRFFGDEVNFLISEWYKFNTIFPSDIDKAKTAIDDLLLYHNESKT